MNYKTILTVLTNSADAKRTVVTAANAALAHDAHLDVLVLGVDRTQLGYSYLGTEAALMQVGIDHAEADVSDLQAEVTAALGAERSNLRYSVKTEIVQLVAISDLVARHARYVDLVILPLPYGANRGSEAEAVVESALFEGKAPVLMLPVLGLGQHVQPKRIVLAWNQTAEAMTAIRRAMPLLKAAELINIVMVDPPGGELGGKADDNGALLRQMLERHGVHADVTTLARTLPHVADVINQHARDQNADLLVMGAYGHSRLREAILGGTTRYMLEGAVIPVLMAR